MGALFRRYAADDGVHLQLPAVAFQYASAGAEVPRQRSVSTTAISLALDCPA
jgi:hypothetical protein